ncbi:MAG: Hsp20/alpha crystallin family protein [Bdellovibrionia bacterium]
MAVRNLLPEAWRGERGFWNPMRELNRMQRRMDQIFGDLVNDTFLTDWRAAAQPLGEIEERFSPPCDVVETDSQYLMSFDLPGVSRNEIKIELKDNQLVVSGERKHEEVKEGLERSTQERYYGAFMRSFTLPNQIDLERIEAQFENGVLTITVPKLEVKKHKQVEIKIGAALPQPKEMKAEKPEKAA